MEDRLRSNVLVFRPDLYTGHVLTIAVIITAVEVGIVACIPQSGQVALASGWVALVVAAFVRLQSVKRAHRLTSEMEPYRVIVAICAVGFLGWISCISFSSVPEAMRLPLLTAARFMVLQNMLAALNAAMIAALAIWILDNSLELVRRLR